MPDEPEERQEDRDHDRGREGDRPADLGRGGERLLAARAARVRDPVHDVLGHDDRGVHQQADRDREPAERHGVEPDASALEQHARERDRERNRERHEQRRAQIAEQAEDHADHEQRAEQNRAADAAERELTSSDWS